ncbi:hypothetical protein [Fluviispira multicolorata]|uniref:Uncharacterized protein n=1 Tax=Fluviispira multicolorata TaxID=2654512 RepID=A0A833N3Q2_9BACT|nr:hypothetical protein [Fluviispira multicolorata]KAB8029092.1 hypothetical protein GCL57_11165 [Fluviispira multicolorata]
MLISIDSLLSLNTPIENISTYVILYWIVSGLFVQIFLMLIDKALPVGFFSHSKETQFTRRFIYFLAGGALLPMLILIAPPFLFVSYLGKIFEEKFYRKSL